MASLSDGSWQGAGFAKKRIAGGLCNVPGPLPPFERAPHCVAAFTIPAVHGLCGDSEYPMSPTRTRMKPLFVQLETMMALGVGRWGGLPTKRGLEKGKPMRFELANVRFFDDYCM